jgi:hypothetical protein
MHFTGLVAFEVIRNNTAKIGPCGVYGCTLSKNQSVGISRPIPFALASW